MEYVAESYSWMVSWPKSVIQLFSAVSPALTVLVSDNASPSVSQFAMRIV